jgi:hypothetical protein
MKRVKDFLYGPAAPIVGLAAVAGALLLAWALADWPFFLFLVALAAGGMRFVFTYGGAVMIAALCEAVRVTNLIRKKQPGQYGYIDEAEILTQPIPMTLNKIGTSVGSAEDEADKLTQEQTGAPKVLGVVAMRIMAAGIVAAKRMGKRWYYMDSTAADLPDDDSDGTDGSEPVTVEPYPAALEPV